MTHSPAEIIAKLGELDPAEIARLLGDAQTVGEPGSARECPVARYVRQESGRDVQVGTEAWRLGPESGILPRNVGRFVGEFDAGLHPALEERPS